MSVSSLSETAFGLRLFPVLSRKMHAQAFRSATVGWWTLKLLAWSSKKRARRLR